MKFYIRIKEHRDYGFVIEVGEMVIRKGRAIIQWQDNLYSSLSRQLITMLWNNLLQRYDSKYFKITKYVSKDNCLNNIAFFAPDTEAFKVYG